MTAPPPPEPPPHRGRIASYLLGAPRLHLVAIAVLAATTLIFAGWRALSVRSLERANARQRTALLAMAHDAMLEQSAELLRLSAQPLAWAIRTEVLAGDLNDVDAYMDKLVKEQFVRRIVFVDKDGVVAAATNVKLKGQRAEAALPGIELKATAPRIDRTGDELRIVVPVMGFDTQIGTLVLDYSTESIVAKLR